MRTFGKYCRVAAGAMLFAFSAGAEVTFENTRFALKVGDDARVKSLVLKATGEELLDLRDPTPFASVTQERPFNNEIKLAYPNARTTYEANRLRREGDRIIVGFDIAPYEAVLRVKTTENYIAFTLEDFILTEKSYPRCPTTTVPLDFTAPPVAEFTLFKLPVKDRANFGEWLNVMWDDTAAVGVLATSEFGIVHAAKRTGYHLMQADALRSVRVRGTGAALVVDASGEKFLDRVAALEKDYKLPRGVENRRNPLVNASIYFAENFNLDTVAEHIRYAKKGGFRLMLISIGNFMGPAGDYEYNSRFKGGFADVKKALDQVHAAGIQPGLHILHTFIAWNSKRIKSGDRRLQLEETYTLSKDLGEKDTEVYVDENPRNAEMSERCRLLKFGREILSYKAFTTKRPYKFTGVKRGVMGTKAKAHEEGLIGGTLWVCEYGGSCYYLKQDSDLQDEIAARIGAFWKAGMRFVYFDGSEGVCPPFAFHVPNAQYRMWKKFDPEPILGEGAAKSHFGWHMLSGANAFDVFFPEEFKAKIAEYPAAEAPLMRRDFSRVNFGWWGFWCPGAKIRDTPTIGVQPDMWEYGCSKAAAWDCPASMQMHTDRLKAHPRTDDLLEIVRRWEDVREKKWLTEEMRKDLRDVKREFHLYLDEKGSYALKEITMLPSPKKAPNLRGFIFTHGGKRVLAYWHQAGRGDVTWAMGAKGASVKGAVDRLKYLVTDLSAAAVRRAFLAAEMP